MIGMRKFKTKWLIFLDLVLAPVVSSKCQDFPAPAKPTTSEIEGCGDLC